jgi:hypothetical protein
VSRAKLAGAAVVVVLLLVWTVRSFVVDAGERTPATEPAVSASDGTETTDVGLVATPVAAGEVSGIPVGYPRTRAGAATAAVNWVASFPRLMRLNPLSLQNTLTDLMSKDGALSGVDEVIADYFELYEELGPEFRERVWIESPLQTLLVEQSDTAARVAVWSVVVTGAGPDDETVVSIWRTHRIGVVWERDDWKIDGVDVAEGPTPVTTDLALPASPAAFVEVDSWTPAVFADTTNGQID